jgi:hypothetical protein
MELILDDCKESLVNFPAARRKSDARQLRGDDEAIQFSQECSPPRQAAGARRLPTLHSLPSRSESRGTTFLSYNCIFDFAVFSLDVPVVLRAMGYG